ncbi:hypothetical protein ACQUQP_10235 [Marinobacterium sp. YM272]|uniref:hypothetical protein n=1 Tax=Marinobacterium sp. YM272 TaxID=3421654 RepID=UPI003D7F7E08
MSAQSNRPLEEGDETLYFQVLPAGAYYATFSAEPDDMRALLLQLLSSDTAVPYIPALLGKLTGLNNEEADKLLTNMCGRNFLELVTEPLEIVSGALQDILPDLIAPLGEGKVLLADEQGFSLAQKGFEREEEDAVAGLAADVIMLYERHESLIANQLGLLGCSWALVNAVGQSDLGFWVLTIGREKFLLIIEGMPYLNRQPFVDLTSVLIRRYLDH